MIFIVLTSVDGMWSSWGDWRNCSTDMDSICRGNDVSFRTRNCTNPEPKLGGRDCPGSNSMTTTVGKIFSMAHHVFSFIIEFYYFHIYLQAVLWFQCSCIQQILSRSGARIVYFYLFQTVLWRIAGQLPLVRDKCAGISCQILQGITTLCLISAEIRRLQIPTWLTFLIADYRLCLMQLSISECHYKSGNAFQQALSSYSSFI